ncbi:MAG TPA: hypothetical protein PLY21_18155, partial [Spirochaetota bacterium]|nr:hypothetical protein [Spirochaetota bacterium]
ISCLIELYALSAIRLTDFRCSILSECILARTSEGVKPFREYLFKGCWKSIINKTLAKND